MLFESTSNHHLILFGNSRLYLHEHARGHAEDLGSMHYRNTKRIEYIGLHHASENIHHTAMRVSIGEGSLLNVLHCRDSRLLACWTTDQSSHSCSARTQFNWHYG